MFYNFLPLLVYIDCGFCASDVFQVGIWREAPSLEDPLLQSLLPDLLDLQLESKAISTLSKYNNGWSRWRRWPSSKMGVSVIPAKPLHIALFITDLCQTAIQKGTGISSIEGLLYSIRWAHKLAGVERCPTDHPLVKSSLEGARGKLGRPINPKEPLSIDLLLVITEHYSSSDSLIHIRFLFVLLVGFAGFFPDRRAISHETQRHYFI